MRIYEKSIEKLFRDPGGSFTSVDNYSLSTVSYNKYIPLALLHNTIYLEDYKYAYPKISLFSRDNSLYINYHVYFTQLVNFLTGFRYFGEISFKEDKVEKTIYAAFGTILDERGKILFLTAISSEAFLKTVVELGRVSFDTLSIRDKKIYISTELKSYKKVYKKVKETFLDDYLDSGCELSIMSSESIEKVVYGNEFESSLNLETVEDKKSFIDFFKNTIL